MADNAPATAEQFITDYGVAPEVAADLARQANNISGRNGFAARAESEHSIDNFVPSNPVAPQIQGDASAARAEWDRLTADRAAGKISNYQWNDAAAIARRNALVATIAGAPPEKPSVQELSDAASAHDRQPMDAALAQHFTPPPAPSDYKFPHGEVELTDEQMASDSALKAALHAEHLPASMIFSIGENLRSSIASLANETPSQMQSRIDGNRARMTAMFAKEGSTFDQAMQTIDAQLEEWRKNATLGPIIEKTARFFTPLDWDAIWQFAKHRNTNQRSTS